jgi:outer membrane protein assembly factor BamB
VGGTHPLGTPGIAVANGRLIFTGTGVVEAFDAHGGRNCSGSPKVCQPLWQVASEVDVLAASGDTVLVRDGSSGAATLLVLNAATGATLWRSDGSASVGTEPAIANGIVYVGASDGRLLAYDLAGATGCAGTPKVCTPLWQTGTGAALSAPSVANGVVYVSASDGAVRAFDAAGQLRCSTTSHPTTCSPLWSTMLGSAAHPPVIANGRLYVRSANNDIFAFETSG